MSNDAPQVDFDDVLEHLARACDELDDACASCGGKIEAELRDLQAQINRTMETIRSKRRAR